MKNTRKSKVTGQNASVATRLLLVVNIVFVFLLLVSLSAYYISPVSIWPIAFAGLAYPLLLVINLFFVLFWIVFLKRYFLFSLLTIILGFQQLDAFIQIRKPGEYRVQPNDFKVMSYNVRLFDLYHWMENENNDKSRQKIFELINKESADVLCLQEYYGGKEKSIRYADSILGHGKLSYFFEGYIDNGSRILPFGLATFSRYPIVYSKKEVFSNSYQNFCLVTDILKDSDTIRIINTHLESIRFKKEDYIFVNDLTNNTAGKNDIRIGTRTILKKMKTAYQKRAQQVKELAELLSESPHKVILCADFNDTPASYSYHRIANTHQDAFREAGSGLGQTYAQLLPILRIDYIFTDNSMKIKHYETLHNDLSDHYPITAIVGSHK